MNIAICYQRGKHHTICQDALATEHVKQGTKSLCLAVICDGIGSLKGSEETAMYVSGMTRRWFYQELLEKKISFRRRSLENAVERLLSMLCNNLMRGCKRGENTGTTFALLLVQKKRLLPWYTAFLYSVGDSRIYRIGQKNELLTKDHIYQGKALQKCIGTFPFSPGDACILKLKPGELLYVCSDGMYKGASDEEIFDFLAPEELLGRESLQKHLDALQGLLTDRGNTDDQSGIAIWLV